MCVCIYSVNYLMNINNNIRIAAILLPKIKNCNLILSPHYASTFWQSLISCVDSKTYWTHHITFLLFNISIFFFCLSLIYCQCLSQENQAEKFPFSELQRRLQISPLPSNSRLPIVTELEDKELLELALRLAGEKVSTNSLVK